MAWARRVGLACLDTVPERPSIGFYEKLGFTVVGRQVKAVKQLSQRKPPSGVEAVELGEGDEPRGMLLVLGVYRPGPLTWRISWKDTYTRPRRPSAYEITLSGLHVVSLLDPVSPDLASAVAWCRNAPSLKALR